MSIKERLTEIKSIPARRFLLLRMADVDTDIALKICKVNKGTYNNWCKDERFVAIHRQRGELVRDFQQEAIHMLRKETQLSAVMLEARIINKLVQEIETEEYVLMKTSLAKEVYSKLIGDLDHQPKALALTWEQRVQQLTLTSPAQITEAQGECIDAEYTEANSSEEAEHTPCLLSQENLQEPAPIEATV